MHKQGVCMKTLSVAPVQIWNLLKIKDVRLENVLFPGENRNPPSNTCFSSQLAKPTILQPNPRVRRSFVQLGQLVRRTVAVMCCQLNVPSSWHLLH